MNIKRTCKKCWQNRSDWCTYKSNATYFRSIKTTTKTHRVYHFYCKIMMIVWCIFNFKKSELSLPNQEACDGVSESDSFTLCLFGIPVRAGITIPANTIQNPQPMSKTLSMVVARNYTQAEEEREREREISWCHWTQNLMQFNEMLKLKLKVERLNWRHLKWHKWDSY